jgi:hypothetical protein
MANNVNISPVISPDVVKTISSSTAIKTFGDQIKDGAKAKLLSVSIGKLQELRQRVQEIILAEIKLGSDHNTELKRLSILKKNNQITQEKYDEAVAAENNSYEEKKAALVERRNQLEIEIQNIILDPYRKIKEANNRRKARRKRRKQLSKQQRAEARRALAKKVALNAAKTLAPIIALQLTNKFASIISQRARLEALVDQVNEYIIRANTPEQIVIATNLRNNTVTLINNTINKLTSLQKTINQINLYLTIFNAVVRILSALPIPTAGPPGIGIPVNLITRIITTIEKSLRLISALSVILAIATISLENEIAKLNELIERLKEINQLLDSKSATDLNEQQFNELSSAIYTNVDDFPSYKGFKFKIKVEENKAFEVKGNKRRYAVATDRDGVEVLKSEYSFTLDPQDLVDQLKLVIDQRNLQG